MKDKETNLDFSSNKTGVLLVDDRCGCDRRQISSQGFTYVSMVGWICRREKSRRCDDDEET